MVQPPILLSLTLLPQEPGSQPAGPTSQGGGTGPAPTNPEAQVPDPQGGGGAGGQPPGQCGTETFVMMGLFLVLMWLLVLRPEQKRRKETQQMLSLLKVGDTVVTIGGMHGTVQSLDDKQVILRVDDVRMVFDRTAISRVVRDEAAAAEQGGAAGKS